MSIQLSDIRDLLTEYNNQRGFWRKRSRRGWFDQRDIRRLRRAFARDLAQDNDPVLSAAQITTLRELLGNKRTKNGHLSHRLLQGLQGKLDDYDDEEVRQQEQARQRLHALMHRPEAVPLNRSCAFAMLTTDTIDAVCRGLSKADIHSLSQCSRFFYRETHTIYRRRLPFEVINAMAHGVFDDKIKRLLTENPRLLMAKAKVSDYAGHTITGPEGKGITPYQLALASGIPEWVEFMNPLFEKLQDGEAERQRQIQAQLPHGWVDDMESVICIDEYLDAIIDTIIAATPEQVTAEENYNPAVPEEEKSPLRKVLDEFRRRLTSEREVRAGKMVNHQNLLNAFKRYEARFADFANWYKRNLYCHQIIGYLGRDESVLAKKFAIGIKYLEGRKIHWDGTFKFMLAGRAASYFPVDSEAGVSYWFDFYYGRPCKHRHPARHRPGDPPLGRAAMLKAFSERTHQELAVLLKHRQQHRTLGV